MLDKLYPLKLLMQDSEFLSCYFYNALMSFTVSFPSMLASTIYLMLPKMRRAKICQYLMQLILVMQQDF